MVELLDLITGDFLVLKVLAVIPAYNEEQSIVKVIENLCEFAPNVDILVVNDGSADNTAAICRANHHCVLIDMPFNAGLAYAVQTGLIYASEHGYDYALQFDGDGQHRAEYIKDMLAESQKGYDIVIGSRFFSEKRSGSMRMLGSVLISMVIRLTTRIKITDPTSGMRLYNKKLLKEFAENINYEPEPDTLAYLARKGVRICEIQVTMDEREYGISYFTVAKSIAYMMRMCFSILVIQWFRKRDTTIE
jgi:glycosyltransferase involved in cell wall biosynthesis